MNKHKKETVTGMGRITVRCGMPSTLKQLLAIVSDRLNREQGMMPKVRLEWRMVRAPYYKGREVCVDYSFMCRDWDFRDYNPYED